MRILLYFCEYSVEVNIVSIVAETKDKKKLENLCKNWGLFGNVPRKLKDKLTKTRYISDYYSVFKSTD